MKNLEKKIKNNQGMTLIELMVVLAIFAVLSAIVIFNYGDFEARVNIKNLASDIALKVVDAQKSSESGLLPPAVFSPIPNWKPSYGVYFNPSVDNKSFFYFVDLDDNTYYSGTDCAGECMNKVTITKGNNISALNVFYQNGSSGPLSDLTISFARPNSGAIMRSTTGFSSQVSYVQITISSPSANQTSLIKLYPSGRVQIN